MCDICGSSSCAVSFHTLDEQERYEKVIAAFEHARELRRKVDEEIAAELSSGETDG